jgi:hypothetical protein
MTVTDEMVLAGALAVRKRRMELNGIGRDFDPTIPPSAEQLDLTRCALTAALSDQVVAERSAQDVMDSRNKQFGFARDLNEAICDAIDSGVTESRAIAARVTTDPRIKLWLPSVAAPASTAGEVAK